MSLQVEIYKDFGKFKMDVEYVDHITFFGDIKIIFDTVLKAFLRHDGISSGTSVTMEEFMGNEDYISE